MGHREIQWDADSYREWEIPMYPERYWDTEQHRTHSSNSKSPADAQIQSEHTHIHTRAQTHAQTFMFGRECRCFLLADTAYIGIHEMFASGSLPPRYDILGEVLCNIVCMSCVHSVQNNKCIMPHSAQGRNKWIPRAANSLGNSLRKPDEETRWGNPLRKPAEEIRWGSPRRLDFPMPGRGWPYVTVGLVHASIMARVHACMYSTTVIVHACTIARLHAWTIVTVRVFDIAIVLHGKVETAHACSVAVPHMYTTCMDYRYGTCIWYSLSTTC